MFTKNNDNKDRVYHTFFDIMNSDQITFFTDICIDSYHHPKDLNKYKNGNTSNNI